MASWPGRTAERVPATCLAAPAPVILAMPAAGPRNTAADRSRCLRHVLRIGGLRIEDDPGRPALARWEAVVSWLTSIQAAPAGRPASPW